MVESFTDFLLPPFAKYLRKYLKEWRRTDVGGAVMIPKEDYSFDSVLIRSKRLSWSADKTWLFVASVTIVDRDLFTTEKIPLYQKLKGYECELVKQGIIRKKYNFVHSPILAQLKTEIPTLEIQNNLLSILEEDNHLMEKIAKINPDKLSLSMFHPPIETKKIEIFIDAYKEVYQAPTEIIWNISLEKYLSNLLTKHNYTQILDLIMETLNSASEIIRKITHRTEFLL